MARYYRVSFTTNCPALFENQVLQAVFQAAELSNTSVLETRFVPIEEDNYETAHAVINYVKSLPGCVQFSSYDLVECELKDIRKLLMLPMKSADATEV